MQDVVDFTKLFLRAATQESQASTRRQVPNITEHHPTMIIAWRQQNRGEKGAGKVRRKD